MPLPTDKTTSSLYSGVGSLWNPGDLTQGGSVDPSGPSFYPNGTIDLKGEDGKTGEAGPQGEAGPAGPGLDPLTLERIDALELATEDAKASFRDEVSLRIDGDRVEASHREALGATLRTDLGAEISANFEQAQTLIIDGDRAEATAREQLGVALRSELGAEVDAKVTSAVKVVADDQHALAERVDGLEAGYTSPAALDAHIDAKVSQASSVLADADRALSQRLDTAAATYITASRAQDIATTTATAKVSEAQSALAAADKALSDRVGVVEASYVTAAAANNIAASVATAKVADEAKVRADALSSMGVRTQALEAGFTVEAGALNPNPSFKAWSSPNQPPDNWAWWDAFAGINRVVGVNGRPFAAQFNVPANQNSGILQSLNAAFGAYVIEFTGRATDWQGAGVLAQFCGPGAGDPVYENAVLSAASTPDTSGYTSPDGGNGGYTRSFSVFYQTQIDGRIQRIQLYAMANWDSFGARTAKTITFDRVSIRPATAAEIAAQRADTHANDALARVGSLEYATANPNGAVAKRISNVEATAGDAQARVGGVEYAISNPSGAVVQRFNNVEAVAGGASSNASIALDAARDAQGKLGQARVRLLADAGNGRAQLELYADAYGNNGADLTGNLRIHGNLTVDGSIDGQQKLAANSVSNAVSTVQYGMQISNNVTNSTVFKNSNEIALNYTGGRLRVDAQFECYSSENATGQGGVYARLMMRQSNGSVVPVSRDVNIATNQRNPYSFWVLTQSYVGLTSFWIEFRLIKSSGTNAIYSIDYIQMMAEEAKR